MLSKRDSIMVGFLRYLRAQNMDGGDARYFKKTNAPDLPEGTATQGKLEVAVSNSEMGQVIQQAAENGFVTLYRGDSPQDLVYVRRFLAAGSTHIGHVDEGDSAGACVSGGV